jgi:hypothetical protein
MNISLSLALVIRYSQLSGVDKSLLSLSPLSPSLPLSLPPLAPPPLLYHDICHGKMYIGTQMTIVQV